MPDQADISIIIPVFNGAKYIKKCLDSLLNQELKPCEIIVVDNGSTDDTVALVGNYKKIYLLEEKVPGAGMARNKGAGKARGLILAFIDADCQAKRDSPKSAIGFGWVSSLRFVAAKKTFQQVHRLLPAAI